MNEFITPSEIEQLSDQELRAKYFEIFNALAEKQQAAQECAELIFALNKIEVAINLRTKKSFL